MKTLLITLLLLSPFAYAGMDRICTIVLTEIGTSIDVEAQIEKRECERNNVLEVLAVEKNEAKLLLISNQFCRFDRNRDIERNVLSCILYSTKARSEP